MNQAIDNVSDNKENKYTFSFKECFKTSISSFKYKKSKLFLTILCLIIVMVLIGSITMFYDANPNKAALKYAYKNTGYVILDAYYAKEAKFDSSLFSKLKMPILKTYTKQKNYDINAVSTDIFNKLMDYGTVPIFNYDIKYRESLPITNDEFEKTFLYYPTDNVMKISLANSNSCTEYSDTLPLEIDSRFIDKSLCHPPRNKTEIAITDIRAQVYMDLGFVDEDNNIIEINTPDDLIGIKIGDFTICGVYSTPESEIIFENRNNQLIVGEIIKHSIVGDDNANILATKWIMYNGFAKSELEGTADESFSNTGRFILPTINSVRKDLKFINNLSKKENNDTYFMIDCLTLHTNNVMEANYESKLVMLFFPLIISFVLLIIIYYIFLSKYIRKLLTSKESIFKDLALKGYDKQNIKCTIMIDALIINIIVMVLFYILTIFYTNYINSVWFIVPYIRISTFTILTSAIILIVYPILIPIFMDKKINNLYNAES
ncbi:hypothetical protein J6Y73_03925 [bacterium]|nr:hypothetical protein [bacterium]